MVRRTKSDIRKTLLVRLYKRVLRKKFKENMKTYFILLYAVPNVFILLKNINDLNIRFIFALEIIILLTAVALIIVYSVLESFYVMRGTEAYKNMAITVGLTYKEEKDRQLAAQKLLPGNNFILLESCPDLDDNQDTAEEIKEENKEKIKEEIKEEIKEGIKEGIKEEIKEGIKEEIKEELITSLLKSWTVLLNQLQEEDVENKEEL